MEPVEHRNDEVTGEPTYEPASQRDNLLVFVVHVLKGLEVIRTEIVLQRNRYVLAGEDIYPHRGLAGHQIMIGICFSLISHGNIS